MGVADRKLKKKNERSTNLYSLIVKNVVVIQ